MSILAYSHPTWCDPRCCTTDHTNQLDHREAPLAFCVDTGAVSLGLTRIDDIERAQTTGYARTTLIVDGDLGSADVDLTAAEARMLAAALVRCAERAEARQPVPGGAR